MDVYIVRRDAYDIDTSRVDIIGVFDTEEKANALKKHNEDIDNKYKMRLKACETCPLMQDLDEYFSMCDDHDLVPEESEIKRRVELFRNNSDCGCDIEGMMDADGVMYDVLCVSRERLYWANQETYYYKVIRMELQ